ncbi:hypothetical protein [Vibrio phage vB_VmeM-Yong XC32]|nr:hypothetical protein [Vibrio phage vB_VmeM-Yong XC31]QAX96331.1 hypothetical protein [Vibrio phage vB_VmeM-Yong XC32]QAX96649.1 hypothetical protein [Vibrio phage vB_VmeM-Yong MS31]QAX96967.1 hypothetical protein [Vibrio phage vB_VmeM-Yong MS32]
MKKILSKVFSGLLEKTDKKIIMTRVEDIMNNIKDNTVPMTLLDPSVGANTSIYRALDETFKSRRLNVTGYGRNPTAFIKESFEKLMADRAKWESLFKDSFRRDVFKEALTYDQAQLLTFLLLLEEADTYVRKFLYVVARLEVDEPLKPKEQPYAKAAADQKEMYKLAAVLDAIQRGPDKISEALAKIKDVNYQPGEEDIIRRLKGNASDPFQANLIPVIGDINVFIGELKNLYLKKKYDRAQDEVARLQTTVYYLEQRAAGASEEELAGIQKQIDYYTNRINRLSAWIEDTEESARGGYEYN